jgi:crossover junction endodeoxyribonuclease RuvC
MRVLGIDPGSSATGYGVLEGSAGRPIHVAHGILRPPRTASLPVRLAALHAALGELVALHRPDLAVVERVFVAASVRSALVLGEARGALLAALAGAGVPIVEYAPREIKLATTGSGGAAKRDVQRMVRSRLALVQLPACDAADALAAALCHLQAGPLAAALGATRRSRRRSTWRAVRAGQELGR